MRTTPSRLQPIIGFGRLVGLTFALIAPASSVFLTFGVAYGEAGPGIVYAYAFGAVVNLAVMLCYAELGSRYPAAGGDYTLLSRSLGSRVGGMYAVLFAAKGSTVPALIALTTAGYLHQLIPGMPETAGAAAVLLLTLGIASLDLGTSSLITNGMVIAEVAVFAGFVVAGLQHVAQPWQVFWQPTAYHVSRWLPAATAAIYGLNGPQAYLYFSEETEVSPKRLARTIVSSAMATVAIELIGVVVGTLALPSLLERSSTLPLAAVAGPWSHRMLLVGITVTLFDTGLATTMSYARIFYAIARDRQWPRSINLWCTRLSSRGIPWGALTMLGALNVTVVAVADVHRLVTLTGTVIIVIYLGVGWAALANRWELPRPPYSLPAWPVPPLLAIAGLGFVVSQIRPMQLAGAAMLVGLGVLWSWVAPAPG